MRRMLDSQFVVLQIRLAIGRARTASRCSDFLLPPFCAQCLLALNLVRLLLLESPLNATRAQNREPADHSRARTHFPVQQHGAAVRIQTRIRRARASDPANESAAAAHANSRRRSRRCACVTG